MKTFAEILAFSLGVDGNGTHEHAFCTATEAELRIFAKQVISLDPGSRVVEIGTYSGRSSSVYLQVQKDLNLDVHLVECLYWNPQYASERFWKLVVENFGFADVAFTYHKDVSCAVAAQWSLPIDFLYLDGEHEMPYVDEDFANWTRFVKSGGVMAVHDSDHHAVNACLDRYCRDGDWELLDSAQRMTIWRKP